MMELEVVFFSFNTREMETCWCYITEGLKNKTQYLFLASPVGLAFSSLSSFYFSLLQCFFLLSSLCYVDRPLELYAPCP